MAYKFYQWTQADITKIKVDPRSARLVAADYGCSKYTILGIRAGKTGAYTKRVWTSELREAVRADAVDGMSRKELCEKYKANKGTISTIVRGRNYWADRVASGNPYRRPDKKKADHLDPL